MDTDAVRVAGVPTIAEDGAVKPTSMREDTLRVSGTLAVVPPDAVPVMVRECVPVGVAPAPLVVVRVSVLVQGDTPGVQDVGLKDADAPAGSPVPEKVIASPVPPVLVAVMMLVLLVVAPWITEMSRSLARVKVKAGVAVIFKRNVVVFPRGPLSVTVMVMGAVVTAADTGTARESTMSLAQEKPMAAGGVQDAGLKDALTPAGSPVTLLGMKETAEGVPERVVTCMVWVPVVPRRMLTDPPLESA